MVAGNYNDRSQVEQARTVQGNKGAVKTFSFLRSITCSIKWRTSTLQKSDGTHGELEVGWVLRTRTNIRFIKKLGMYRFRFKKMYLYPTMLPVLQGDEYMVTLTEDEDEIFKGG